MSHRSFFRCILIDIKTTNVTIIPPRIPITDTRTPITDSRSRVLEIEPRSSGQFIPVAIILCM